MEQKTTERGFVYFEFKDLYGAKCTIQESSLASQDAIWLGIDNPNPQIMCSDARRMGIREWKENMEENNGWCEFEIPKEVLLTTRMHLSRDQAKDLIKKLRNFVKTGSLSSES